mgnify:CR=1 FL=1
MDWGGVQACWLFGCVGNSTLLVSCGWQLSTLFDWGFVVRGGFGAQC